MIDFRQFRIPITKRVDEILNPEYISEIIGSFFLVFTVCINVLQQLEAKSSLSLAPLSIGTILVAMIFATGGYSALIVYFTCF